MRYYKTYKTFNIYLIAPNSMGLKYETYISGQYLRADTLAGIKHLINKRITNK
jgi:hypothetical protein